MKNFKGFGPVTIRRTIFAMLGLVLFVMALSSLQKNRQSDDVSMSMPYSHFLMLVDSGLVESAVVDPSTGTVKAELRPAADARPAAPSQVDPAPAQDVALVSAPTPPAQDPLDVPVSGDAPEEGTSDTEDLPVLPTDTLVDILASGKSSVSTVAPVGAESLIDRMAERGDISIVVSPPEKKSAWAGLLLFMLPVLVLIAFFYWMSKRQGGGMADRAISFGKGKARMVDPANNPVRLSDVAGCDEAKEEVSEIVNFLRRPEDYERVNARPPKGVLMMGAPGTGKTLLAKAIAGEAGVPFFSVSGSDFVEMFVGVGASRVRNLFETVKDAAPAIVFIDEIDAVGKSRAGSGGPGGSNDEREQTLNQLLVEMDGFEKNSGVVVIAATNRADVLDPALRRPGRFDREVTVPLPDRTGRAQILRLHAQKVPVAMDVDWDKIAKGTPGFSGADLANLVNEAALLAARAKKNTVSADDLEDARDKIIMGAARKGTVLGDRERKIVAYHEAGHALVAHYLPDTDPVHKITIIPRSGSLGVTMQLPDEDSYNSDAAKLRGQIAVLLGGRAAERVALSTSTVGASNDFDRATKIARGMVGVWGMSDLGTVSVHGERGENAWGTSGWSEHWKRRVDDASVEILDTEFTRAMDVLQNHRNVLDVVAKDLLDNETVDSARFLELIAQAEGEPAGQKHID